MNWFEDPFETILLVIATLLLLGVLASKASHKLGVPALLLFLLIGMLAGSEGLGRIQFDNALIAQNLGIVALAYILFAGGLDTHWQSVRPALWNGVSLATIGVALTAGFTGLAAIRLLDLPLLEGLLLGAIVSSTDAAAVFGVLRSRQLHLGRRLRHLLELESGSNDPAAVFLTLALISLLMTPNVGPLSLALFFVLQFSIGIAFGVAAGKLLIFMINRLHLEYDGLYPVLTLSMVLITYGATAALEGSGFLAVYVAGLTLGKATFVHKGSLIHFHDGLAWLMQIAMFLVLGLLVFPSQLIPVAVNGFLLSGFLIFVARPVAVLAALPKAGLDLREKIFLAWAGLKGAVPIILATFPLLEGVPNAGLIFNLVFFVVLTSVLAQGTTIPAVARWLRLGEKPEPGQAQAASQRQGSVDNRSSVTQEFHLASGSPAVGMLLEKVGLPHGALVLALRRGGRTFIPSGDTVLQEGDRLLVLVEVGSLNAVRNALLGTEGPLRDTDQAT